MRWRADSLRVRSGAEVMIQLERLTSELIMQHEMAARLERRLRELAVSEAIGEREQLIRENDQARDLAQKLRSTAIRQSSLRTMLGRLCEKVEAPPGWMGVNFEGRIQVTAPERGPEVWRFEEYPTIVSVEPGSPAERAGLRSGDRVLVIAGHDMRERDIVFNQLLRPGSRLPFSLEREGQRRRVTVVVEKAPPGASQGCGRIDARLPELVAGVAPVAGPTPSRHELFVTTPSPSVRVTAVAPSGRFSTLRPAPAPAAPAVPSTQVISPVATPAPAALAGAAGMLVMGGMRGIVAGAEVMRMDDDFRRTLGVKHGVLVLSVGPRTPASRAGLKSGDVILMVDRRTVQSPMTLVTAIRSAEGSEVALHVMRAKQPRTLHLRWESER